MNVPSPCMGNCRISIRTGLCEGCLRTTDEIAAWTQMTDRQRLQLIPILEQRALQQPATE